MIGSAVLRLLLFVIFIFTLDQCVGLYCKDGTYLKHKSNVVFNKTDLKLCHSEMQYCGTAFCSTGEVEFTHWKCSSHNDPTFCKNLYTEDVKKMPEIDKELVRCDCTYGAREEEVPIELQQPKRVEELICKSGSYDHEGYGILHVDGEKCKKGDYYCYIANCRTDRESHMKWGCAESKDCNALAAKISKYKHLNWTCQCAFGEGRVDLGNENLTVPMWIPPILINFEVSNDFNFNSYVQILAHGMVKMRQLFNSVTGHDITDSLTIPSACMKFFTELTKKDNERIAIIPHLGYEKRGKQSTIARKYLKWRAEEEMRENGRTLQHVDSPGGEHEYGNYRLDGMVERPDEDKNLALEPILERWFEDNPHPGWLQIEQYTDYLNSMAYRQNYPHISTHNVKIWFKNRRAKTKRLMGGADGQQQQQQMLSNTTSSTAAGGGGWTPSSMA